MDDHKYSLNRVVAYPHDDPEHPDAVYGPGGPGRTYGKVVEVHRTEGDRPHWEYTVRNSFTGEVRLLSEDRIYHGANRGYLDIHRRDGIPWLHGPPESAKNDTENHFWKRTLREFVRTAIPGIIEHEQDEEKARSEGRNLNLGPGDYVRVQSLRPETEPCHNLYAKVLTVSAADREFMDIGPRKHKVLLSYRVRVDNGLEADVYDLEIKTVYTTLGRTVIQNWRAATFLADAFGDDPPYDVQLEYLNGHVFTRAELADMPADDLADLLTRLLYVKGLILLDELAEKAERLAKSPAEYLVDQILDISRFDMKANRPLTPAEIERFRSEDARLKGLLE